ncbi:MAG TPA: 2-dehydro-3-deoxy-D-gluconate 5-dehydrogenase KduD [Bacteroidota bacterium]|nr:2-dehydro-3-deoxy-D-gluconate 5-dehydrogenase KduD [Bacteroidota bacterium]
MCKLFDLTGKIAIVTGASTGLGQGMSIGLAEAGANLVLVDYVEMSETENIISSLGRDYISLKLDLMNKESIDIIVNETKKKFGTIDILVNNAGIIRRAPAIEFTEKDWDDVMYLNSKVVFFLSQAVAKIMIPNKRGKIINIASMLSFQGGIIVPSYSASKGAVAQITKALANEWAQYGINVNAIAPGYMATNNTANIRKDPERFKSISDRIPAGRWGLPDDLKGPVVFLASSASDYVNGHILAVDGGWLAR